MLYQEAFSLPLTEWAKKEEDDKMQPVYVDLKHLM